MAAVSALLVSSGIALMAASTTAAADDQCVPKDAYTEVTPTWVDASPGAGWVQTDVRVKTPATEGQWTDLVWHNYTGNQPETAPALDDPRWHALPADPQAETHSVPPRVPNEPYNVSNENSGNGSWFLWTGTWVPGTDAVYEYKFSFTHPAVTCEVTPPTVEPPVVSPPKHHAKAKAETTTPTVVHAGLVGDLASSENRDAQGLVLIATGLLLMAGAGGLVLRKGGERSTTS